MTEEVKIPSKTKLLCLLHGGVEVALYYDDDRGGMAPIWRYADGPMKDQFAPWPMEWKPFPDGDEA